MREQFEAWALERELSLLRLVRSGSQYASTNTQEAWLAWQASRGAALEEAAGKLRKMHEAQKDSPAAHNYYLFAANKLREDVNILS